MRKFSAIFLLCCCFGQISCSTKLAYNFLDWAIEWKIKSMVSLNREQKVFMKDAVTRFHQWHRKTQLPQYADYLTEVALRLDKRPFTAREIHLETDKVQILMDQSLEQVIPDLVSMMSQLDDRQASELLESVAEERQDYIDEYVDISVEKQRDKRYDDFVDNFKPWVGSLDNKQKKRIKLWAKEIKPYETLNVKQQLRWEEQLKHTLSQRHDPKALDKALRGLMFYRTDDWIPELEATLDFNQTLTYELIESLLAGLSEKQHEHLIKELLNYAEICRELAAEAT